MSRLTDLIAETKVKDPQLGADLEREFRALSSRLSFGLNFERHRPEAVELPRRPVRKGDKVRVLPERGSTAKGDQRLWQVAALHTQDGAKVADLRLLGGEPSESRTVPLADLVVVAEFKDTIYPGMVSTGKVERGGDKPFHTVINGENFHALRALTWTHRGKVDVIYIDPPYNTGAKDWKYNNDYVEAEDLYRHSKWLAFMERRLELAAQLLNPQRSALIIAIDEREYLRLGLLLEQLFPAASIQMVSTVIKPGGAIRGGAFARSDEYLFFLRFGSAAIIAPRAEAAEQGGKEVPWRSSLTRGDFASQRGTVKGGASQFYPIFVDPTTHRIVGFGKPLAPDERRDDVIPPAGSIAVFPVRPDGREMNWGLVKESAQRLLDKGYLSAGPYRQGKPQPYPIRYLTSGKIADIENGVAEVVGRAPDGSVLAFYHGGGAAERPATTQWDKKAHSSTTYGTGILKALLPDRRFPFPKSLYAVEDCLRFVVAEQADAIVLDFFAGSGTTAHAVMRLNKQDGGRRQCISITNNEVAPDEQTTLRTKGFRSGDPEWEEWGICDYITKPRIAAALTGKTPDGAPIKGDYKFTDEFPMADGFEENAEFFTLSYETPVAVTHNVAFGRIAPLLWMRAGSQGPQIRRIPEGGWDVVERYGLLAEPDQASPFLEAVHAAKGLRIAYIVTDDERRFQAVARRLPPGVEPVRLYESYLTNFAFSSGGEE